MMKSFDLLQIISFTSLGLIAMPACATPCSGAGATLNISGAGLSCSAEDSNYKNILIENNAEVSQDISVNITPDEAQSYYGLKAVSGGKYIFGSSNDTNTFSITASQNGSSAGENQVLLSTGRNSLIDITANNVNIATTTSNTGGGFTFGIRADNFGQISIEADEITSIMTNTTNNNASGLAISANNGGQLVIKGKNGGLSLTTVTIEGKDSPSGLSSTTNSSTNTSLKLDIVDVTVIGKSLLFPSNYNTGVYTEGTGARLEFLGGKITTRATDAFSYGGSAIRTRDHSVVNIAGYDTALTPGYAGLDISTATMDSRGIRATGGSEVFINQDAQSANFITRITTTGSISDGLNAGRLGQAGEYGSIRAGSRIVIHGTTDIETRAANSYGLRLIGDGSSIEILKVAGQTERSRIHSNSTAIRYGFANGYNQDSSNTTVTGGQSITIEGADITSAGAADAWVRQNTGTNALISDTNGNNTWTTGHLIQVGDHQGDVGVQGESGYAMTVADAVQNGVLTLRDSTATSAAGKDLLNVTYGGGTPLIADKTSSSFVLNAESSILKGRIFTDTTLDKDNKASVSTLNLSDHSEWYIERDSNTTHLNVQNSKVYLNTADNWTSATPGNIGNVLTVDTLSGNGHFFFNTDIVAQQTDKLIVQNSGQAAGTHAVTVKNDAGQATTGSEVIDIIETQDGSAHFALYQNVPVELGAWEYGLRKAVDGAGQANGNWQLYALNQRSSTAQAFNSFVNTNYMLTYIDIQTLLQRMGELRDTENDGDFWIRGFAGKLNSFSSHSFSGYDMHYRGTQAGIDRLLRTTGAGRLYVGGMAGYIDANQDFKKGSGSSRNYHFGLYGTYIADDGLYLDGVVKYARLRNSFNVRDSQGASVSGTGNTDAISLSGEIGKRFHMNEGRQSLYIEPQAQIVYTHNGSDSTRASNQLKVKFNSHDSLIGRGSAIIGYQIADTENPVNIYFKTGYVREFKGRAAYKVNDAKETVSFRGGWFENGIGMTATIDKRHNLYGEASYSNGNRFDKQQIDFGYRYTF